MNCANCGAPVIGHICEYCGTVYDHADTDNIKALKARIHKNEFEASQKKQTEYILRLMQISTI